MAVFIIFDGRRYIVWEGVGVVIILAHLIAASSCGYRRKPGQLAGLKGFTPFHLGDVIRI